MVLRTQEAPASSLCPIEDFFGLVGECLILGIFRAWEPHGCQGLACKEILSLFAVFLWARYESTIKSMCSRSLRFIRFVFCLGLL